MNKLVLFLLLWALPCALAAQDGAEEEQPASIESEEGEDMEAVAAPLATPPPPVIPVATRPLEAQKWADASKGLDYSKDQPEPPKPPKNNPKWPDANIDWLGIGKFWGNILQILLIALAVAGMGYGIYRMMQQPRSRIIARDGVEITAANLDQYLHETDLDYFLRDALAKGNYALAVRLYYLQAIKQLSEKGAIQWSREKTNRDYMREMRSHPLSESFRTATRTFEQVWYGNQGLTQNSFAQIEPTFKNLLTAI